jgi:hypothetical protein
MSGFRILSRLSLAVVALAIVVTGWLWYLRPEVGKFSAPIALALLAVWLTITVVRKAPSIRGSTTLAASDADAWKAIKATASVFAMGTVAASGTMLCMVFGAILAKQLDLIGTEATDALALRGANLAFGLIWAAVGNALPKMLLPRPLSVQGEVRGQTYKRVAGWISALGGLAYAGVWLAAPVPLPAAMYGMAILLAAGLAPQLYALWLLFKPQTPLTRH